MPLDLTLPEPGPTDVWGADLNSALVAVQDAVNDLEALLAAKAALVHGHALADVTGLVSALAGKAALVHAHSADDVTSGVLPVARGGTGETTLTDLRAAMGLGLGAHIYRANTGTADTASGVTRTMVGYDSTEYADDGYVVNHAAGTITVPEDGVYLVTGHARFSALFTGGTSLLSVSDGTVDVIRGTQASAQVIDIHVGGQTPRIDAGTALRLSLFTATSASCVGNAAGNYYTLRVTRVG